MFLLDLVIPALAKKFNWDRARSFVASAQTKGIRAIQTFGGQEVDGAEIEFYFEPDIEGLQRKRGGAVVLPQDSNKDDCLIVNAFPVKTNGISYEGAVRLRLNPVTKEVDINIRSREAGNGSDMRTTYFGLVGENGIVNNLQRFQADVSLEPYEIDELTPDTRAATDSEISDVSPTLQKRAEVFAQMLIREGILVA